MSTQIDRELKLKFKSDLFNALGVFELEESSRTPNGTQFWTDCDKAVDRYVTALKQELKQSLEAQMPKETDIEFEKSLTRIGRTEDYCKGWNDYNKRVQKAIDTVFQLKEEK